MVRVTILEVLVYRNGHLERERHESRIEMVSEGHVSRLKTFGGEYARLRGSTLEEISRDWCQRSFEKAATAQYQYPKVSDLIRAGEGLTDLGDWAGLTNPADLPKTRAGGSGRKARGRPR